MRTLWVVVLATLLALPAAANEALIRKVLEPKLGGAKIEGVERDIKGREDLILEEMEKAEGLAATVKREEADFKAIEAEARQSQAELDAVAAKLQASAASLRAERDSAAASVPEDARALYTRVARQRGSGVAEAKDGMCQACHVRLRIQVWVEVRKNEQII